MNATEIKALIDSGKARFDGTRLVMLEQTKVKPKYGNKVTEVAGKKFDSKKEAAFFLQLQQDPTVKSIQTQVVFELIPKQKGERACSYKADFVVEYHDGRTVVYDVKGMKTDVYRIKRKLMLWVHGVTIQEV